MCTKINHTCCVYVDETQRIETDVRKLWEQIKAIHQVTLDDTSFRFTVLWNRLTSSLPNFVWLKQLFTACVVLLFLGIFICYVVSCVCLSNQVEIMRHGNSVRYARRWKAGCIFINP